MLNAGDTHGPTLKDLLHQPVSRNTLEEGVIVGAIGGEHPFITTDVQERLDELIFIPARQVDWPLDLAIIESGGDNPLEID